MNSRLLFTEKMALLNLHFNYDYARQRERFCEIIRVWLAKKGGGNKANNDIMWFFDCELTSLCCTLQWELVLCSFPVSDICLPYIYKQATC